MKIGLYFVLSLLIVIVTAVSVYMINPGTYSFEVFGINMPMLPIAVWVAIPVAILALLSILHMMFYSTRNFFNIRKLRADAKRLEDSVYWSLIKEPTAVNFASDAMKSSASILSGSYLEPVDIDSLSMPDKIKDTAKSIAKINSGEYVDLSKEKFTKHLSEKNPIKILNDYNHLGQDATFALKIVESRDKHSDDLVEEALDKIVENEDFYKLKKYAKEIGKERFFKLLSRVESGEDIGFSEDMLKSFIKEYDFDCKDYYRVAKVTLKVFKPDDNLALFKELSTKDEQAMPSYLYILFKYEMLDKIKDILEESEESEFKALKAFYALKKSKYNYKIDDLIGDNNICK